MNAAELRALVERLKVTQALFADDDACITQAAEILGLLMWAEDNGVRVARGPLCWIAKVSDEYISSPTLIDTLRRAREASKS